MTNFEKYKNELIGCLSLGEGFSVTKDGKIAKCETAKCRMCIFDKIGCVAGRSDWLKEEVGGESEPWEKTDSRGDLEGILDQAYITCVTDIISGNVGTGEYERDMDTLYGIFQMYRQARMLMEGNGRKDDV